MNYSVKLSSDKKGFIKNVAENVSFVEAQNAMEKESKNFGNNYEVISSVYRCEVINTDFHVNRDLRENFKIDVVEE